MIDLDAGLTLQRQGLERFLRLLSSASEGAHLFEAPGVVASVSPVASTHSVANSVLYDDAADLAAALDALAEHYEGCDIEAWTVWVPERDRDAAELLADAGHVLDADPAAMVLELKDIEEAPPEAVGGLDWDAAADPAEVGRLNDHAYGFDHAAFELLLAGVPADDGVHLYQARENGELASVLGMLDVGSDSTVFFVATHREHRGRGLARELLRAALVEARDRGLETSSLQSTKLGQPVYERLGYRPLCALEMWERRRR
jgi:GNAT superfamily N-acetyltransferase